MALELPVFDEVLNGTLDALVRTPDGGVWIWDWKREDELDAGEWEHCRPPVSHLWANKLTKHALQLNTYAFIVEQPRYADLFVSSPTHHVAGLRIIQIYPRSAEALAAGGRVVRTHVLRNDLRAEVAAMRAIALLRGTRGES